MKRYVDGFVFVVPKNKIDEYKKMAQLGGKIWMKHGALEYIECIGDDLKPDMDGMKMPTFIDLTKAKKNEIACFSFIVYKSRAHRDKVNAKVMADPEMQPGKDFKMPFDPQRMSYGGFESIVALAAK